MYHHLVRVGRCLHLMPPSVQFAWKLWILPPQVLTLHGRGHLAIINIMCNALKIIVAHGSTTLVLSVALG